MKVAIMIFGPTQTSHSNFIKKLANSNLKRRNFSHFCGFQNFRFFPLSKSWKLTSTTSNLKVKSSIFISSRNFSNKDENELLNEAKTQAMELMKEESFEEEKKKYKEQQKKIEEEKELEQTSYIPPLKSLFISVSTITALAIAFIFGYLYYYEEIDEEANEKASFTEVVPRIWTTRYHFRMNLPKFAAMSSNMFVVNIDPLFFDQTNEPTNVLIYNPVELTQTIQNHLKQLNLNPKFLVIGNKEHFKFFVKWIQEFPKIKVYCPIGSKEKVLTKLQSKNISSDNLFIEEISEKAIEEWQNAGVFHHTIQGYPGCSEIVLFHKPSKILLVTDAAMCVEDDIVAFKRPHYSFIKLYAKRNGVYKQLGVSSGYKLIIQDKEKIKQSINLISSWNWRGLGMAHGNVILPSANSPLEREKWKESWTNLLN